MKAFVRQHNLSGDPIGALETTCPITMRPRVRTFTCHMDFKAALCQETALVARPSDAYIDLIFSSPPSGMDGFDFDSIPPATNEALYYWQRSAIDAIVSEFNGRALLAFDMGTGKTITTIVVASHYKGMTLYIVPRNKMKDWADEQVMWLGTDPSLIQCIYKGKTVLDERARYVIVPFDIAKNHAGILAVNWDVAVVDECHFLKTDVSIRAKKLIPVIKRAKVVLLLSGTPLENRPAELFNTLTCLSPQVFTSRRAFSTRYCKGHLNRFNKWEERGAENLDELALLTSRLSIRVTADVLPLLPLIRTQIRMPAIEPAHLELLEELAVTRRELNMAAHAPGPAAEFAEKRRDNHCNKMWASCGDIKASIARPWVESLFAAHPGEKVVFFVASLKASATMAQTLREMGHDPAVITGETSMPRREEMLRSLRSSEGEARTAVLTIATCGTGINLCPGVSVIVMVEMERKPSSNTQAEARAHRLGANRQVSSYWLLLTGTYDEEIFRSLAAKRATADAVVDGGKRIKLKFDKVVNFEFQEPQNVSRKLLRLDNILCDADPSGFHDLHDAGDCIQIAE